MNDAYSFNSAPLNIRVTLAYVIAALRGIAAREPNRVGRGEGGACVYANVVDGVLTPICIVGQFIANEGLLRFLLMDQDRPLPLNETPLNVGACVVNGDVWARLDRIGFVVEPEARTFLYAVQVEQDDNLNWAEAVERGVEMYRKQKMQKAEQVRDRAKAEADDQFVQAQQDLDDLFS